MDPSQLNAMRRQNVWLLIANNMHIFQEKKIKEDFEDLAQRLLREVEEEMHRKNAVVNSSRSVNGRTNFLLQLFIPAIQKQQPKTTLLRHLPPQLKAKQGNLGTVCCFELDPSSIQIFQRCPLMIYSITSTPKQTMRQQRKNADYRRRIHCYICTINKKCLIQVLNAGVGDFITRIYRKVAEDVQVLKSRRSCTTMR